MDYRIFISHSWKYSNEYDRLESLLKQELGSFYNHSVPECNPITGCRTNVQLEAAIDSKIRGCSCVVIPAGMYINHSRWIQKEIEIAKRYGKPIIAVEPWGSLRTPDLVKNQATSIVGWNAKSIGNEIRKYC